MASIESLLFCAATADPREFAAFAFNTTSTVCFAALLITIISSERLRTTRHPVLLNLFITLLLYSSLMMLSGFGRFRGLQAFLDTNVLGNDLGCTSANVIFQIVVGDVPWMMTQIATLNLIIHVWYTLRSTGSSSPSQRAKSRCQVLLLVTPYVFGLLPLIELLPINIFAIVGLTTIVEAILITVTSVWDIIILTSFIRRSQNFQKLGMGHSFSARFLAKILVFSGYRLTLTVLNVISALFLLSGGPIPSVVILGKSLFPLLVFVLLGLRKDVFEAWFPGHFDTHPDRSSAFDPA